MAILVNRQLTEEEIDVLFTEVKTTPNILGATKEEWHSFGSIWVAEHEGRLAGVAANKDLGHTWSEMMMLYVLVRYRNLGIGRQLFEAAWHELEERGRRIYVVSRNPAVIKMMTEKGMRFTNLFLLPLEIQRHNICLILNTYRLREAARKSIVFRGQSLVFQHAINETKRG